MIYMKLHQSLTLGMHRIARLVKKCIALNYGNFFEVDSFSEIYYVKYKTAISLFKLQCFLKPMPIAPFVSHCISSQRFQSSVPYLPFLREFGPLSVGKFIERMMSVMVSFDLLVSRRPPTQVTSDWAGVQRYDSRKPQLVFVFL